MSNTDELTYIEDDWISLESWMEYLYPEDYLRLTTFGLKAQPCPWCGGRTRCNPICCSLSDNWAPTYPSGPFCGKRAADFPTRFLIWDVKTDAYPDRELRRTVMDELIRRCFDQSEPDREEIAEALTMDDARQAKRIREEQARERNV